MSLADYYSQIQRLWRELESYKFVPTGQEKDVENWHIYELLGGVNSDYEIVQAQVLSQDPLQSIDTVFALIKVEDDCRCVMLERIKYHNHKNDLLSW